MRYLRRQIQSHWILTHFEGVADRRPIFRHSYYLLDALNPDVSSFEEAIESSFAAETGGLGIVPVVWPLMPPFRQYAFSARPD